MLRTTIVLLILCAASLTAFAQQSDPAAEINEKQWQELLAALGEEKWKTAADLSAKHLKRLNKDAERR